MIEVITATKSQVEELTPIRQTCIAYAALEDGKVIGIVGYYIDKMRVVLFSSLTDRIRKFPILMFKTGKKVIQQAIQTGLPVHSIPDTKIEASIRFLERLGFVQVSKEVWQWQIQ